MKRPAAWTDDRAARHALQRAPSAPLGPVDPPGGASDDVLARLRDGAPDGYEAAFPDAELVTFTAMGTLSDAIIVLWR